VILLPENFKKAISYGERFVATKPQIPVLGNLLFQAKEGQFFVAATNLETGIKFRIGAKIEGEGAVTVPARVISELVASLPTEKVFLSVEGEELSIKCGRFTATIQGLTGAEFPVFPKKDKGLTLEVPTTFFQEVVERVGFAASSDESRPVLTGILFNWQRRVRAVATDGYRLSLMEADLGEGVVKKEVEVKTLLPARSLSEVERVLSDLGEQTIRLTWSLEQRQMFWTTGDLEVVVRALEGDFPDYQGIIPGEGETIVEIDRNELLQAVKLAAVFARDSANIVKWRFTKEGLEISARSSQVGTNITTVGVDYHKGNSGTIAFNSRYLLECLSRFREERVRFEMTEALRPGVFTGVKSKQEFKHIIMPVRVQEE